MGGAAARRPLFPLRPEAAVRGRQRPRPAHGCGHARQARSAYNYLRTPNAELAAASVGIRADIYDAVERMADTRFGEVDARGDAPANRMSQAAAHIANAANNPNTDAGLVQLISAIDILKGETPQIP